jgi:hypothetical protein
MLEVLDLTETEQRSKDEVILNALDIEEPYVSMKINLSLNRFFSFRKPVIPTILKKHLHLPWKSSKKLIVNESHDKKYENLKKGHFSNSNKFILIKFFFSSRFSSRCCLFSNNWWSIKFSWNCTEYFR